MAPGLGNGGTGAEVAVQNGHAAGLGERLLHRLDDGGILRILVDVAGQILGQRLAADGHDGGIQQAAQMLHDTGDTTGPVEGLHLRLGSGIDLGDLGRGLGKSLELLQHVHIQLRLVGDGGQVQHGVVEPQMAMVTLMALRMASLVRI